MKGWKKKKNAARPSSVRKKTKIIPSHKKSCAAPVSLHSFFYYLELLEGLLVEAEVLNVSFKSLSFTSMSAFFITF